MQHKKVKDLNYYDKILILLIVSQVFGVVGGVARPTRIFVIIFIPAMIIFYIKRKKVSATFRYELVFFLLWIIYGFMSLVWTPSPSTGLNELLYLLLNICTYLLVIYFASRASYPKESIILGWRIMFLLMVPIALIEITLNWHLPQNIYESEIDYILNGIVTTRNYASVTFGNLNGYNTVICYSIPFMLGNLLAKENKKLRILDWALLFIISFIVFTNSSKGTYLVWIISIIIFVAYYLNYKGRSKGYLIFMGMVFIFLYYFYFSFSYSVGISRLGSIFNTRNYRSVLIEKGIDALVQSRYLGTGAGSIQQVMGQKYMLAVTSVHNLFIEIGAQYGLLILIMFFGLLVRIFLRSIRSDSAVKMNYIIFTSLSLLPIIVAINSSYLPESGIWLFIGSLTVMSLTYSPRP
jgi:teichuronic acid biosynthesis protein TuaE